MIEIDRQKSLLIGGDFLHHLFQEKPADKWERFFWKGWDGVTGSQLSREDFLGEFWNLLTGTYQLVTARQNVLTAIYAS